MKAILLFAISILVPATAAAQGSGGSGSVGSVGGGGGSVGASAFDVTKTIKLVLVSAKGNGTIVVLSDNGQQQTVKLDKKLRIRAEKDTELAGKKNLAQQDLLPGMLLKITYRASDLVALELRILKDPAKA